MKYLLYLLFLLASCQAPAQNGYLIGLYESTSKPYESYKEIQDFSKGDWFHICFDDTNYFKEVILPYMKERGIDSNKATWLDLGGNIANLHGLAAMFPHAKWLRIDSLRLPKLSFQFENTPEVTSILIELTFDLRELPESMFRLKKLEKLEIYSCFLKELPPSFNSAPMLKYCSITCPRIEKWKEIKDLNDYNADQTPGFTYESRRSCFCPLGAVNYGVELTNSTKTDSVHFCLPLGKCIDVSLVNFNSLKKIDFGATLTDRYESIELTNFSQLTKINNLYCKSFSITSIQFSKIYSLIQDPKNCKIDTLIIDYSRQIFPSNAITDIKDLKSLYIIMIGKTVTYKGRIRRPLEYFRLRHLCKKVKKERPDMHVALLIGKRTITF